MSVSRLTIAVALLLVGCALIVLAGLQMAVMVDAITRFGAEARSRTASGP